MAVFQKQSKNKIFNKDIFHNKKILFKKKIVKKNIIYILEKLFKKRVKVKYYYEIISNTQNSKNYIIQFNKKKFILKSEKIFKSNKIEIQKKNFLEKKIGKKLSLPINSLIDNKKNLYSLFKFKDGKHFDGDIKSFKSIIYLLPKLYLKRFKNIGFEDVIYFSKNQNQVVDFLKKRILSVKNKTSSFERKNLNFLKFFVFEWTRLKDLYKNKINKNKHLFHNDLHPHNIIVLKKNKISVLDYRSFKLVNFEISLSYCLLKLCRQILSNKDKLEKNKLRKDTLLIIKKKFSFFKFSSNIKILDLAKIEIFRRICFIIENIQKKNYQYNFILPVLINNMLEAEEIFARESFFPSKNNEN